MATIKKQTKKNKSLFLEVVSTIQKFILLREQASNIPMPPILAQQLQKEKGILQQMLSGQVQKGTSIQSTPMVNAYIQHAVGAGLRDPNQILSGFDQYFVQQSAKQAPAALPKKQVVAPPSSIFNPHQTKAGATPTFDPKDPFGTKAREQEKGALLRHKANLASMRQAFGGEEEYQKKLAKKMGTDMPPEKSTVALGARGRKPNIPEGKQIIAKNLIEYLVVLTRNPNGYASFRKMYESNLKLKQELCYLDSLYEEIKQVVAILES